MSRVAPERYAYAVGKIRALENFMLKQDVFEEALDLSLDDALRLFAEADLYSDELLHVKNSDELEVILQREFVKLRRTVSDLLIEDELKALIDVPTLERIAAAADYPSELLSDYLHSIIDMHNILTFVRLTVLSEPADAVRDRIRYSGLIPKEDFYQLYGSDVSALIARIENVHKRIRMMDYARYLKEGIERAARERSFITLEKSINDLLMDQIKPAKHMSFGPEPVVAYYFAKMNEIQLMRMILLGKLNALPNEFIRQRISNVYA